MMNVSTIFDLDLSVYELHYYQNHGKTVVVYLCILLVLGIVGNGHVLLVYGRTGIQLNYQIFVMALAIYDFLACTIIIPNEIVLTRYSITYRNVGACKVFKFLLYTLSITSISLFALTGFERYRRICTPFKEKLTRKTVLVACCTTSGLSFLISIPVLVLYGNVEIEMTEYPYLNDTKCGYSGGTFKYAYLGLIALAGTILFIFVLAVYIMIARVLFKHRHFALGPHSNENKINLKSDSRRFKQSSTAIRNTISLMCVIVFSFMGTIPLCILLLIKIADEKTYSKATEALGEAGSNILMKGYFLNNVVNPIVYIIVDKQFRGGIRKTYVAIWNLQEAKIGNKMTFYGPYRNSPVGDE